MCCHVQPVLMVHCSCVCGGFTDPFAADNVQGENLVFPVYYWLTPQVCFKLTSVYKTLFRKCEEVVIEAKM